MSVFSRAKHDAKLSTHHIFFFEANWGHGYQKRLREHPANTPLVEIPVHQTIHDEMRKRDMDGLPVLPRPWITELLRQCRTEQTYDSISRMKLCLGNIAVVSAREPRYGEMYMDLANKAIEFLDLQQDILRDEVYTPKIVFYKS